MLADGSTHPPHTIRAAFRRWQVVLLGGGAAGTHLSAGSWKLTMAVGRETAAPELESERKHSLSTLVKRGRSTGRPLMKKNCLSPAARPDPTITLLTKLRTQGAAHWPTTGSTGATLYRMSMLLFRWGRLPF